MASEPITPSKGQRVRIRRYIQPSLTPGDIARELSSDVTATATKVWPQGNVIDLDPATAVVHYVNNEGRRDDPFGLAWRVGLDFVFLGGKPQDGTCMYLVTEVEVLPEAGDGSMERARAKLTAEPFGIPAAQAQPTLEYACIHGMRRLVDVGHDVGIRYDTAYGFRVYDLTEEAGQEGYAQAGDPA